MPTRNAPQSAAGFHSGGQRTPRLLVAAAGLALAAFGLLGGLALMEGGGVAGFERRDGHLLPDLRNRIGSVARIEITGPASSITLIDDGGTWRLQESGGYPAESAAVNAALQGLAELKAAYVSKSETDPERHGVGRPGTGYGAGTAVTLRDGEGVALAALILGPPFSSPGETVEPMLFARIGEENRVWLAAGALEMPADPLAWLDRHIADVPRRQVSAVTTDAPDGRRLAIRRSPEGELTVAEGLPAEMRVNGPGTLHSVVSLLERMRFEAVRPADAAAPSPADMWQASVETEQGVTYRIRLLERAADGYWGTISATATGESVTAENAARFAAQFNERHDGWAYLLPAYATERLTTRPEDLTR